MKRINKIVSAFLNLLQVASYVSLCACSSNYNGDPPQEVKELENVQNEGKKTKNVQNKEGSDKPNEAEKNLDKFTNLLTTCQFLKEVKNEDKYAKETCSSAKDDKETCSSAKHAKAKNHKKGKGSNGNSSPRHQRTESSVNDLKTTHILGDLSIVFDATGKLKINNCPYRVKNEDEFKIFLEYLERAKKEEKSINGLASIFPKEEKERKGNNDSVRLWKKDWFWKSINAHWNLFKELNLQKFSIKPYSDATEKIFIEGLGLTDFLFSDIVNKVDSLDGKKEKTTKTKTVAEIKAEYNKVFQIKADHTPKKK